MDDKANTWQIEVVDVVVVGAGCAGLVMAKTYLQCAPATRLIILDSYTSIGGTWAKERLYPGLRSNNLVGTFEYPSFPMTREFGVEEGDYISGPSMHQYLATFAERFELMARVRLNTTATTARKSPDASCEWEVDVRLHEPEQPSRHYRIKCQKLIITTGMTSQPEFFKLPGQERFGYPVVHFIDLPKFSSTLQAGKAVSVIGGSKGAHDTVHLLASSGAHVNWIIRESGYGPTWMVPSFLQVGPFGRYWVEQLMAQRFLGWFSPCIWDIEKGLSFWARRWLQGTWLGRKACDLVWEMLSSQALTEGGLNSHPSLAPLKPTTSAQWYSTSLSILNYGKDKSLYEFVKKGKVTIYRSDPSHFSPGSLHLSSGQAISSEGGVITYGWQIHPNIEFEPKSMHADLGIPSDAYGNTQKAFWHRLDAHAERAVLNALPRLRTAPARPVKVEEHKQMLAPISEPFRLYRFLAPPGLAARKDRSLVLVSFGATFLNLTRLEIAALWCYAYLNGQLDSLDETTGSNVKRNVDFEYQAALTSRFCALRYPFAFGHVRPDFGFEQVQYFDNLLQDLGLSWRRKTGWISEIFGFYGPADYRDLVEVWLSRHRGRSGLEPRISAEVAIGQ